MGPVFLQLKASKQQVTKKKKATPKKKKDKINKDIPLFGIKGTLLIL
jgi:hypothetical protein